MTGPTRSYLKVPYDIRMAKQVERRMIIDLLLRLRSGGFDVGTYQYTGMGSIYFVDCILLHRFAGVKKLVSVEYSDEIRKRVRFNKPFNCVELEFGPIGDYIPKLNRDRQHILWLDYDDYANEMQLVDVVQAATVLSPGSLLFITVDVQPPKECRRPRDFRTFFENRLGNFFDRTWGNAFFAPSNLASAMAEIIKRSVDRGLVGREDVQLLPLCNFLYADGHEMLTVGGMIAGEAERRRLRGCEFSDAVYIRHDLARPAYRIPNIYVTRKERLHLDANMPPKTPGWRPTTFELEEDVVRAYAEIYRYLPSYAELLL